jgi:hypothetical protein
LRVRTLLVNARGWSIVASQPNPSPKTATSIVASACRQDA